MFSRAGTKLNAEKAEKSITSALAKTQAPRIVQEREEVTILLGVAWIQAQSQPCLKSVHQLKRGTEERCMNGGMKQLQGIIDAVSVTVSQIVTVGWDFKK